MPELTDIDLPAAHKYFAATCFNHTWDLMDKPARTLEEDEAMIHTCLASIFHWTQRPDHTATHLSIGYWQAARVYTLVGQLENARRYGLRCLAFSQMDGVEPFYRGYAYEALARAEAAAGDRAKSQEYLQAAFQAAAQVTDGEEKGQLEADLATIH